ncbi:MAG: peptide-methionine (R)-S-oxide reductase MsrB [Cyanobium sp.]
MVGALAGAFPLMLRPARAMAASKAGDPRWALSEAQWKERLSPAAYRVLRLEGTEPAFTSALNNEKRSGLYRCAGCRLALFKSQTKFDSGTGWPSFWQPLPGAVGTKVDFKLLVPRTEYHCHRCGGHQGHVFKDGPKPTGLRYCNNGVALVFEAAAP